jgi:hypothetical protein
MPGYDWNSTVLNGYYLTGTTVPGNPSVGLTLENNTEIGSLVIYHDNGDSSIGFTAPVPEPATWALLAGGFGALLVFVRRRRGTTD